MTDDDVKQLDRLFDKKLAPIQGTLAGVQTELQGVKRRLDTVAQHLGHIDDRLTDVEARAMSVEHTQNAQSTQLARIERLLVKQGDQLDDHAERIAVLETKTGDLPTLSPK